MLGNPGRDEADGVGVAGPVLLSPEDEARGRAWCVERGVSVQSTSFDVHLRLGQ